MHVETYFVDLRERVVASVVEGGLSRRQAAAQFCVGISTVIRWVRQFHDTGRVAPGPDGRPQAQADLRGASRLAFGAVRMHMRRFTRLTNAFSKKLINHMHMVAICTAWYYRVRINKTLRVTPAMAANMADRLWGWEEMVARMDAAELPKTRGAYKKRAAEISN